MGRIKAIKLNAKFKCTVLTCDASISKSIRSSYASGDSCDNHKHKRSSYAYIAYMFTEDMVGISVC